MAFRKSKKSKSTRRSSGKLPDIPTLQQLLRMIDDEDNLLFTFSYAVVDVDVNPDVYSEKDKKQMFQIANELANKIYIDKTYVEFLENKHQDTFMYEAGWKELCKLVLKTNFGNNATRSQDQQLSEAYQQMICIYLSNCLKSYGYDDENFSIEISPGSKFQVEVSYDSCQEWRHYPGPWQDWDWQ